MVCRYADHCVFVHSCSLHNPDGDLRVEHEDPQQSDRVPPNARSGETWCGAKTRHGEANRGTPRQTRRQVTASASADTFGVLLRAAVRSFGPCGICINLHYDVPLFINVSK